MKFISVRDLRLKPGEVWKLAKQEKELVITSNGRPIAILRGIDEGSLEEELDIMQRARALAALDTIHKESVMRGTHRIPDQDIQLEINAVRKGKLV